MVTHLLKFVCVRLTGQNGDVMTFNEILDKLRDSDIDEKVKFTMKEYKGYFVKGTYGQITFHRNKDGNVDNPPLFLSDFDRDDWEIIK